MATQGVPYNLATRTATAAPVKKTPLANAAQGIAAPTLTAAKAPSDYTGQINQQFDLAQGRLDSGKQEAARSALENAQRAGAMRGTSGAGFETGIQQEAVNASQKPFMDQTSALASDRAGALTAAGQASDTMKEQQRQFDFSAGLQKYTATNEMDLNKFSTFVNASTALKASGFDNPEAWANIFKADIFPQVLKNAGIQAPSIAGLAASKAADNAAIIGYGTPEYWAAAKKG